MKNLVLLLFLLVTIPVSAQRIDKPGEPYYAYCELYLSNNLVYLVMSKNTKTELLCDDNGEVLKLSRMEAINYMGKRGWEFVCVLEHNIEFYLFKKKVKSDKEILQHLNIKQKKDKSK